MAIYMNNNNKVTDIFVNVNGEKKKVISAWGNRGGIPTKVFSSKKNYDFTNITWSDGSWEEISAMLDAHYAGQINIADYWSVGDERMIDMSYSTSSLETIAAGLRSFVILGFNHDFLSANVSKAAVSVALKYPLNANGRMSLSEPSSGYFSTLRNTWCDSIFKKTLPSNLQKLIKSVNKKTYVNYKSTSSTNGILTLVDKDCWLLSSTEILGFNYGNYDMLNNEGLQYPYFDSFARLSKDKVWWLRSSSQNYSDEFLYVKSSVSSWNNVVGSAPYSNTLGILVGFCI